MGFKSIIKLSNFGNIDQLLKYADMKLSEIIL